MIKCLFLLAVVFSSKIVKFQDGEPSIYITSSNYASVPYFTSDEVELVKHNTIEYADPGIPEVNQESVVYKTFKSDLTQLGLEMHGIKSVEIDGSRLKPGEYSMNYQKDPSILTNKVGFSSKNKELFCNLTSQRVDFAPFEAKDHAELFDRAVNFKSITVFLNIYGIPHSVYLSNYEFITENLVKSTGNLIPDRKFDAVLLEDKGEFAYLFLVNSSISTVYIYKIAVEGTHFIKLEYANVLVYKGISKIPHKIAIENEFAYLLDDSQTVLYFKNIGYNSEALREDSPKTDFIFYGKFDLLDTKEGKKPLEVVDFGIENNILYVVSQNRGIFAFDTLTNKRKTWTFTHPYLKKLYFYTNPLTKLRFMAVTIENIAVNEYLAEFVIPKNKTPFLNKILVSKLRVEARLISDEFFFYLEQGNTLLISRKGLLNQFDEVIFTYTVPQSEDSRGPMHTMFDKKYSQIALVWNSRVSPVVLRNFRIENEELACFLGLNGKVTIKFFSQSELCKDNREEIQLCEREFTLRYIVNKPYYANTSGVGGIVGLIGGSMLIGFLVYIIALTKCCKNNPLKAYKQAKVVDKYQVLNRI